MILLLFLIHQEYDYQDLFNKATTLLVQFQTEQDSAFDLLVQLGSDSLTANTTLDFLVSKFDTKSAIERHRLKDIFKAVGTAAIPSVIKRLDYRGSDEESRHLAQSLWVLGEIGSAEIVEPVVRFIDDPDWRIRSSAYTALGKATAPAALPYLLNGCEDPVNIVRKSAYYALGSDLMDTLPRCLFQGLSDSFYGVRFASVYGLVNSAESLAIEERIGRDQEGDYFLVRVLVDLGVDENKIMRYAHHREARVRMLVYNYTENIQALQEFLVQEGVPLMQSVIKKRIEELTIMHIKNIH